MKLAELERHLRIHGCVFYREGGAPRLGFNAANRKLASVPQHREVKENTARSICRQLEIPRL